MLISNQQSLRAGVQSALMATWKKEFPIYKEMQSAFLRYLPAVNIRKAEYAWKERIPFPKPWPYGKGRQHQMLEDKKIELRLIPYELTIDWDARDAEDDQLGDLKSHASMAMKRFLQLPDVLIGEYMANSASYNYNGLANAYDGVGLYSATDGDGADRFSVSGGNVITGGGVATTAAVFQDILEARQRFLEMQEPVTGQPLHNPQNVVYNRMHFVVPPELDAVFSQLAEQERIYADPAVNTAVSNNLLKGKIKYTVNQRLTDANDWFVVLETDLWRPFAYRAPQKPRELFATMENSDVGREYGREGVYCDLRLAIGPWCPFTTIQVSNS
jgi:hypothetical protein